MHCYWFNSPLMQWGVRKYAVEPFLKLLGSVIVSLERRGWFPVCLCGKHILRDRVVLERGTLANWLQTLGHFMYIALKVTGCSWQPPPGREEIGPFCLFPPCMLELRLGFYPYCVSWLTDSSRGIVWASGTFHKKIAFSVYPPVLGSLTTSDPGNVN